MLSWLPSAWSGVPPALLLANVYDQQVDVQDYWVSEKLDGVRAYWDGRRLLSRQGNEFQAPSWFTAGFPSQPLDGELWMGRGTFEELSGAVRREEPDAAQWLRIRFMVFDLPGSELPFDGRLRQLRTLISALESPWIALVEQFRVSDHSALKQRLHRVVAQDGEGLMLHRADSFYRAGRSDDLLKVKTYEDGEAVVVGYTPGRGKYLGMVGALVVETPETLRFRIGSGLSDEERSNPPAIGSTITYKFFGLTDRGVPRFASFLRVREPVVND